MSVEVRVYVETGNSRTFAGAIEWPGWCRSGKDEESALKSLLEYGPRYARVLRGTGVKFVAPKQLADLKVIERLAGDTTTDFGSPGKAPRADSAPVEKVELRRLQRILEACWRHFDATAKGARGKQLRTGPRGGGRDLQKMTAHVQEAEEAYIGAMGWRGSSGGVKPAAGGMNHVREESLKGMEASAQGAIAPVGPRGGKRWSARYFVRRAAWHVLDHAWEIEDRLAPAKHEAHP